MSQVGPGAHDWRPGIFDADAGGVKAATGIKVAAMTNAAISRTRLITSQYFRPRTDAQDVRLNWHSTTCSQSSSRLTILITASQIVWAFWKRFSFPNPQFNSKLLQSTSMGTL